ncbi:hypothetical protein RRG08_024704 [Elysia crispata]|uniref:Uncharacterized protein n=1 Tax=Elysia crispata TaxID=231223 RepID=A0AAE0YEC3_9GAST|nr:hypothetical protein RRG08_024704 [Elysia crispata]
MDMQLISWFNQGESSASVRPKNQIHREHCFHWRGFKHNLMTTSGQKAVPRSLKSGAHTRSVIPQSDYTPVNSSERLLLSSRR